MKKYIYLLCLIFCGITATAQQTMYWIGGPGNWDDLSHWSFQSGTQGPILPSSIPTSNTHVIFDAASGLTGTGTQTSRNVVIREDSYTIQSLTFAPDLGPTTSPRIVTSGNHSLTVLEDVTLQEYVSFSFKGNNNMGLVMSPVATATSTLTLNNNTGNLSSFIKNGAGTTNIVGDYMSSSYMRVNSGTLNFLGTGFSGHLFSVSGSAELTMPNCTSIALTNDFTLTSTTPLSLPALQTMTLRTMQAGNANSTLNLPDGAIVTANTSWLYTGNINPGTTEFRILDGSFRSKDGSVIEKVVIQNPITRTANIYGASTINNLIFEIANGVFQNSMTIGNLTLAPSASYSIENNRTITLTGSLTDTTPDCTPNYTIGNNTLGATGAQLKNNTGADITLTNATVTDINSSGTNGFTVNGIDGGGNSGSFTFVEPPAKTIYWVGDAGDDEWNNQANWSATSGGPGGYCLPSRFDDVFFDNNSVITGGTVKVTNNNAFFHDITIQDNAPVFNFVRGGSVETGMICYGSWYMRSGMIIATDNVQFKSDDMGETITSNGSLFRLTYFHGEGGWTLQDDFQTQDNTNYHLRFRGGTLNTNGKNVFLGGQFIGNETPLPPTRHLILGSSQISVYYNWGYNAANNTLDAGTSHITVREGRGFRALSGHTYYDLTCVYTTPVPAAVFIITGANVNYHNIHLYNGTTEFQSGGIVANAIHAMATDLRANVWFYGSVTTNILELQANGILRANNNVLVTVNQDFITHTDDCQGLMEMYVNGKAAGQKFTFKAANNVHVPNVWMTGVTADVSTGATYTATGLEDTDVTNWTFTTPVAKELYWLGTADNNWNNGLNWTTNSDGTPSPGGCVPTKYDNVHFNSFSTGNLPIHILDQPAYFNNLIAHNDAPAGITITYPTAMEAYSYGNLIQMGEDMTITRLHLLGDHNDGQLINKGNSSFENLTVNNPTAQWIFTGDMRTTGDYTQTGATVTVDADSWTGHNFVLNGVALNLNVQTVTGNQFVLTKGALKASDLTMTLTYSFLSSGNNAVNNARSLDITNSTIIINDRWEYYNLASITLQATGSHLKVRSHFRGLDGHSYNIIETNGVNQYNNAFTQGDLNINELILNNDRIINGNNTIGKLTIMPKSVTMTLAEGTTQTITDDMQINGTPCQFNTIRSATGTANIAYANPNDHNRFDFVTIGGVNATDADLEFDVNSGSLGNNNSKVIFLTGTPGVVGLGPDQSCVSIDPNIEESYTITAEAFYGGPLSTYKWYKKDSNGVYQQLAVPAETVSIDARDYGFDGEYKVEIVYDATLPANQYCRQEDEITVSYNPENVIFDAGTDEYHFCGNSGGMTVADFVISTATQTEMTTRGAEIKWYATATGGTALNPTDIVVDGEYYAELVVSNTNCVSPARTLVNVIIDEEVVSDAGPSQTKSDIHPILFTMAANNPAVGTGEWVVVSGDVTITNTTAYNTTVTLNSGNSAELKWVVTNGICTAESFVVLSKLSTSPMVNPSLRMRVSQ